MTVTFEPLPAYVGQDIEVVGASTLRRRVTVKPAMCGHNSLFVGQVGDWTWETVSAACGTNAFAATDASGGPTYLSFYYYHLRGDARAHVRAFSFGDELDVVSQAFGYGSESVLTLHRVSPAGLVAGDAGLDAEEFYEQPRPGCLYVENFNRWITRSKEGSNEGLVKSSPVGFRHEHLPRLPDRWSPRRVYSEARDRLAFALPAAVDDVLVDRYAVDYPVDITRDINGVGLIYFATYFSIVDRALLETWRHLGRDDRSFLDRVVTDQKLCYLGNADYDSVLTLTTSIWRRASGDEVANVVVADRGTSRVLAVSTLELHAGHSDVVGD